MVRDRTLREHLADLLTGGGAHASFDAAVARFPASLRGAGHSRAPHTAWELLEHMRIAQRDILEFSRNPAHVSPEWPAGSCPRSKPPPSPHPWAHTLNPFQHNLRP